MNCINTMHESTYMQILDIVIHTDSFAVQPVFIPYKLFSSRSVQPAEMASYRNMDKLYPFEKSGKTVYSVQCIAELLKGI